MQGNETDKVIFTLRDISILQRIHSDSKKKISYCVENTLYQDVYTNVFKVVYVEGRWQYGQYQS